MILISSLLRMWVAATLELGNDEVYYQTYSRYLQWNYFDHPPMVAILIRLSTFNLFFHQALFSRLGSICCAAAGTWVVYEIGKKIQSERAGWIAAILYNTSFYSSVIAGTFILPDSPQLIFWLASIYLMVSILENFHAGVKTLTFFILLGICIGLCTMSKVHGVFLWIGFGGYILFHERLLLKLPGFWIAMLLSLLIISPIIWWNYNNHFITYQYHQSRINFWGSHPDPDHLLQQLLGSVFYNNPVNFILCISLVYFISKGDTKSLPAEYPLFLWLSLPLICILAWTSLFSETLPHWSGPAYISLSILLSCRLDTNFSNASRNRWLKTSGLVYLSVVVLGVFGIQYLPVQIGSQEMDRRGTGDVTLDMVGWQRFSQKLDSLVKADSASGIMKPGAFILSDYWFPAAHLDYYYAIPYHHSLLAIGNIGNIHHFAWLNQRTARLQTGTDAYFIYPSNYYGPPGQSLKDIFGRIDDSLLIPQYRGGNLVRYFVVIRLHEFKGDSLDYLVPGLK